MAAHYEVMEVTYFMDACDVFMVVGRVLCATPSEDFGLSI